MTLLTRISFLFAPLALLVLLVTADSRHTLPVSAGNAATTQGDVNCSDTVDSVDSLQILRDTAGLPASADCLSEAGDVDCSGAADAIDALQILRFIAGLPTNAAPGCTPIGEPLAPAAPPPASEELIAAALEAGDITYEESLWYRALALYDLPGLPDEFRSEVVDYHAANGLFLEVLENEGQLSQQLLDDLAPFMARPADPISIFNNPPAGQAVPAAASDWKHKEAVAGKLRVWVKDNPSAETQLTTYAAEAKKVWDAIGQAPQLFRYGLPDTAGDPAVNPDTSIDIYFAPVNEVDPRKAGCTVHPQPAKCVFLGAGGGYTGYTGAIVNRTSASYIMIDATVTGPTLTSHIAHELMHTGQHAYDVHEPFWLKDSTATWGAVRVLQRLGVTRQPNFDYLPDLFQTFDMTLTDDVRLRRYASFLYFLFATQEKGDGLVKTVWEKAAAGGVQNAEAVDDVFPFADNFDDFAVRNWNKKPPLTKWYRDAGGDPTFPLNLEPKTKPTYPFGFDEERTESDSIKPLASIYYHYTLGDLIHKLTFTNLSTGNPLARIWALYRVGDSDWKDPLELTNTDEKIFCLDLQNENVKELVIIVSNTRMTANKTGPNFKLKAETDGCHGWKGTATGTYLNESGYYERGITTADALWEEEFFLFGCNCRTFFPHGTVSWSWDYTDTNTDPPCSDRATAHVPAGLQFPHKAEQMLTFWQDPGDPDRYYYSATGVSGISRNNLCLANTSITGGIPWYINLQQPNIPFPTPTFPFSLPSSEDIPGPGSHPQFEPAGGSNLCGNKTFTITKNTIHFSGNCFESQDDTGYLKYEWSFSRVNVPE